MELTPREKADLAAMALFCIIVFAMGFVIASIRPEPEYTPCKAQVVEWVRDGGRCSFMPVVSILNGTLENGVCVTAEVGK